MRTIHRACVAACLAAATVTSYISASDEQRPGAGAIDDARIMNVAPGDWLAYGRDFEGHRLSPLTQVIRDNV